MGTKTISIMIDVYDDLVRNKKENESFSDELRRLLKNKRGRISDCVGLLKDVPKSEWDAFDMAIKERRDYSRKMKKKRLKELWG